MKYELRYGTSLNNSEVITIGDRDYVSEALSQDMQELDIQAPYMRSWNIDVNTTQHDFGSDHYFYFITEAGAVVEEEEEEESECDACKEWKKYYGESSDYEAFKEILAFRDHDRGMMIAQELLQENYVVLLSLEEDLLIVSYEWSPGSDRNGLQFTTFL